VINFDLTKAAGRCLTPTWGLFGFYMSGGQMKKPQSRKGAENEDAMGPHVSAVLSL
jgi:hypothetical protein